jgi:hypothetical protein
LKGDIQALRLPHDPRKRWGSLIGRHLKVVRLSMSGPGARRRSTSAIMNSGHPVHDGMIRHGHLPDHALACWW